MRCHESMERATERRERRSRSRGEVYDRRTRPVRSTLIINCDELENEGTENFIMYRPVR